MTTLKIKARTPEIERAYMNMVAENPRMLSLENSGFDLMTVEEVVLINELRRELKTILDITRVEKPVTIDFGISIELPKGYHAEIVPRSSTFEKYGILQSNGIGIIDNSYCGNEDFLKTKVVPLRIESPKIPAFTRIAQLIIRKTEVAKVLFVQNLEGENRGGFGSTGM